MITPDRVAVILLAAGASRRFGDANKLLTPLAGHPLACHAAAMLAGLRFGAGIAVCGAQDDVLQALLREQGFHIASGAASEQGMAGSLGIGMAVAQGRDVEAALVCLADMPFVPVSHIAALLAAYDGQALTSADEQGVRMPPALLPSGQFDAIRALQGDQGARKLLAGAGVVVAPPGALRDIDRPGDLPGTIGAPHS